MECKKKSIDNVPHIVKFLNNDYKYGTKYSLKDFRREWFGKAKSYYQKDFIGHCGCVNAIEFGEDGHLLFSGGDDQKVHMWDVDKAIFDKPYKPTIVKGYHASNIFCLTTDDKNKRLISGGNDEIVVVRDYNANAEVTVYNHDSPIFCLSVSPRDNHTFVTASKRGEITLFDTRVQIGSQTLASHQSPFHSVMYRPLDGNIIATANSRRGCALWDARKPNHRIVRVCSGQGMAVRWNSTGTHLLCLRNGMRPILLDPNAPKTNYIQFDSPSYYNTCTMKSPCFAGDREQFILAGSDDFNIHMWKIPQLWPEKKHISEAHLTLFGHRSIVNQVRYSEKQDLIVSSGVEKVIKLWSPFCLPGGYGDRHNTIYARPRLICSAKRCQDCTPIGLSNDGDVSEDKQMLHFFDNLLRAEIEKDKRQKQAREHRAEGSRFFNKRIILHRTLVTSRKGVCTLTETNVPAPPEFDRGRITLDLTPKLDISSSANSESSSDNSHSEPPESMIYWTPRLHASRRWRAPHAFIPSRALRRRQAVSSEDEDEDDDDDEEEEEEEEGEEEVEVEVAAE